MLLSTDLEREFRGWKKLIFITVWVLLFYNHGNNLFHRWWNEDSKGIYHVPVSDSHWAVVPEVGLRFSCLFVYLFVCDAYGMWKFPGQGSNLHYSSNLSHCSNIVRSLTQSATELLGLPGLKALALLNTLPLQEQTHSISPPFISSHQIGTALKWWLWETI